MTNDDELDNETKIFAALLESIEAYSKKHPQGEQVRVRQYVRWIRDDTRKRLNNRFTTTEILEVWTTVILANNAHAKGLLNIPGAPAQA
jgi:hypothetical protein